VFKFKKMKNQKIFSIIIIMSVIFLPLFTVLAYTETAPDLDSGSVNRQRPANNIPQGGGTTPKRTDGTTPERTDTTISGEGGTIPEGGSTVPGRDTSAPESGSNLLSLGGISLSQFFYNLQLYVWIIFTTLAILMFVFAGFLFLVAQGQPEKLKTARTAFVWGVVGAVIAILAYTIRAILGGIFNF
jgi:hypothetical protein